MTVLSCTELFSGLQNFTEISAKLNIDSSNHIKFSTVNSSVVVWSGTALTILNIQLNDVEVVAEIDFESEVVASCWDSFAECVVVGDVSGTMHLVTSEGSLIFSKKLPLNGWLVKMVDFVIFLFVYFYRG